MQTEYSDITIIYLTETGKNKETSNCSLGCKVQMLSSSLSQEEYVGFLEGMETEKLILVDGKQVGMEMLTAFIRQKKQQFDWEQVGYMAISLPKCRLKNIRNLWYADPQILTSPVLVGSKSTFLKAYAGSDLGSSTLTSIGYSLQKIGGLKFAPLLYQGGKQKTDQESPWKLWYGYTIRLPFNYLISGQFFAQLFCRRGKVKR